MFRSNSQFNWTSLDDAKKRMEKKLDGNYTRMLSTILNKSWKQHLTKEQLSGHFPSISKTNQVRRTRHAAEATINSEVTFFYGPRHIDVPVLADRQEIIYISSIGTLDVVWKTCREWWMIGTDIEEESRKSVLSARLDDDDNEVQFTVEMR